MMFHLGCKVPHLQQLRKVLARLHINIATRHYIQKYYLTGIYNFKWRRVSFTTCYRYYYAKHLCADIRYVYECNDGIKL